jgi:hypothetical protein
MAATARAGAAGSGDGEPPPCTAMSEQVIYRCLAENVDLIANIDHAGRLIRQDLIRQDLIRQDLIRQDLIRQDLIRQDLIRQEMAQLPKFRAE